MFAISYHFNSTSASITYETVASPHWFLPSLVFMPKGKRWREVEKKTNTNIRMAKWKKTQVATPIWTFCYRRNENYWKLVWAKYRDIVSFSSLRNICETCKMQNENQNKQNGFFFFFQFCFLFFYLVYCLLNHIKLTVFFYRNVYNWNKSEEDKTMYLIAASSSFKWWSKSLIWQHCAHIIGNMRMGKYNKKKEKQQKDTQTLKSICNTRQKISRRLNIIIFGDLISFSLFFWWHVKNSNNVRHNKICP